MGDHPTSPWRLVLCLGWLVVEAGGCDCSWASSTSCTGQGDGSRCWTQCCHDNPSPPPPFPRPPPRPPSAPFSGIHFEGRDGKLLANGRPYHIKGVNWWGCEGFPWHAPYGLDVHSVDWYMEWLHQYNFNSVRFFFQLQGVNQNQVVPEHIKGWGTTDYNHVKHAPYLAGLTYVGMIKRLVQDMARHGMTVMLTNHRLSPHAYPGGPGSGKWYNDDITVADVKRAWTTLAKELCNEWNLLGVDRARATANRRTPALGAPHSSGITSACAFI